MTNQKGISGAEKNPSFMSIDSEECANDESVKKHDKDICLIIIISELHSILLLAFLNLARSVTH